MVLIIHICAAVLFIALIAWAVSAINELKGLKKGIAEGFEPTGSYRAAGQGAPALSIEEDGEVLTWSAQGLAGASDTAYELAGKGAVEATQDPNGYRLMAEGNKYVASIHLASTGKGDPAVLYLDILGGDTVKLTRR